MVNNWFRIFLFFLVGRNRNHKVISKKERKLLLKMVIIRLTTPFLDLGEIAVLFLSLPATWKQPICLNLQTNLCYHLRETWWDLWPCFPMKYWTASFHLSCFLFSMFCSSSKFLLRGGALFFWKTLTCIIISKFTFTSFI